MNTKRAIIAILLATVATIVCIIGSQKREPEPTKTIKLVFMQEHSMIDYGAAENYVTDKIDEKKAKVEEYEKSKAEYQERAEAAHEEYLAVLEQQRKARQVASQVTYSEPTVSEAPSESSSVEGGYLGSFKCTGYVATGNTCANGNYPTSGYTIASNSLPMGTRVYIEGIGERVVEDTGGMGNGVIDVFVDSTSEAYALTGDYEVYVIEE